MLLANRLQRHPKDFADPVVTRFEVERERDSHDGGRDRALEKAVPKAVTQNAPPEGAAHGRERHQVERPQLLPDELPEVRGQNVVDEPSSSSSSALATTTIAHQALPVHC